MLTVTVLGQPLPIPVSTVYCIGRNYVAHASELGNAVEAEPVVFLKPPASVIKSGEVIELPAFSKDVHHEVEVVVLIGTGGRNIPEKEALHHVAGYGVGLDLTARDVQTALKLKGLPWLRAKGFASAGCVSDFLAAEKVPDPQGMEFTLQVNGILRQRGQTSLMVFSIAKLIEALSAMTPLWPGDLIFTGTPEGVAAIVSGDHLDIRLGKDLHAGFDVR